MTPPNLVSSPAALELARDAFDQGDEALLGARGVGGPSVRRPVGTTSTVTRDLAGNPAAEGASMAAPYRDDRARVASRSEYDAAHHHYLNAATLYYTGAPRNPHESVGQTIARLPESLGDAIRSAHEDCRRDLDALGDRGDESSVLERTDHYVMRIREELEAREPRVFGNRDLPAETSPTR